MLRVVKSLCLAGIALAATPALAASSFGLTISGSGQPDNDHPLFILSNTSTEGGSAILAFVLFLADSRFEVDRVFAFTANDVNGAPLKHILAEPNGGDPGDHNGLAGNNAGDSAPFAAIAFDGFNRGDSASFRIDLDRITPVFVEQTNYRTALDGAAVGVVFRNGRLAQTTLTGFAQGTGSYSFAAIAAVPEPASWAMMTLGFGLAGLAVRRRGRVIA